MEPSGMEPWWGTHVVPPGRFTLSHGLGMPQHGWTVSDCFHVGLKFNSFQKLVEDGG